MTFRKMKTEYLNVQNRILGSLIKRKFIKLQTKNMVDFSPVIKCMRIQYFQALNSMTQEAQEWISWR